MITAVDTNVLLDVFTADATFLERSRAALRDSISCGRVVACDVVWAEVCAFFPDPAAAREAMQTAGVDFASLSVDDALAAGARWKAYRRAGGSRKRVIADFLIAAHALGDADRLLTRDRGFYRTYFADLELVDPAADDTTAEGPTAEDTTAGEPTPDHPRPPKPEAS